MNRLVDRWLNEYLDGEIGLADKAELERRMAADPELHRRYKQMREAGLLLSSMPEVSTHPYRFRQRMAEALEGRESFITPQRAFAAAMLVALLIVTLSFSLLMFQSKMLGDPSSLPRIQPPVRSEALPTGMRGAVLIDSGVNATEFLSRLMVEDQLGMVESAALYAIVDQTDVLEHATCSDDPLQPVRLAGPQLLFVQLEVAPSVALQLNQVAEGLTGRRDTLRVSTPEGGRIAFEDYLRRNPGRATIPVQLNFQQ